MVLYGMAFLTLAKSIRVEDPGVLQPWYTDGATMRGTARQNAKILCAFTEEVPHNGYLPDPEKSWHICVEGKEKEETKASFEAEGLKLCFTRRQRYLGGLCDG